MYDRFNDLGYDSRLLTIRAYDYGLAQRHLRVALVGFRDGLLERFRMPPVPSAEADRLTLGEALRDIVARNRWEGTEAWANKASIVSPTVIGAASTSNKLGFASIYQKEEWEVADIDSTVLAEEPPMPGHKGHFRLTVEMGARLQGFPDDWKFAGTPDLQKRQIANALPPRRWLADRLDFGGTRRAWLHDGKYTSTHMEVLHEWPADVDFFTNGEFKRLFGRRKMRRRFPCHECVDAGDTRYAGLNKPECATACLGPSGKSIACIMCGCDFAVQRANCQHCDGDVLGANDDDFVGRCHTCGMVAMKTREIPLSCLRWLHSPRLRNPKTSDLRGNHISSSGCRRSPRAAIIG
ncbi:DNA cytosine methyltransferase [Tianweitania sediminis]|uniref:DNA cytosine methyltransferase n=1 Tax=Tianweitania sediminis TaxID=1502156 RepID=A0A8J7UK66_9HYPH|nr:DNA cytosine methyltransferase [Tianweitania sediminis]